MGVLYHVGARYAIAFYMRIAWLLVMFSGYGRTVPREPMAQWFFGSSVESPTRGRVDVLGRIIDVIPENVELLF